VHHLPAKNLTLLFLFHSLSGPPSRVRGSFPLRLLIFNRLEQACPYFLHLFCPHLPLLVCHMMAPSTICRGRHRFFFSKRECGAFPPLFHEPRSSVFNFPLPFLFFLSGCCCESHLECGGVGWVRVVWGGCPFCQEFALFFRSLQLAAFKSPLFFHFLPVLVQGSHSVQLFLFLPAALLQVIWGAWCSRLV